LRHLEKSREVKQDSNSGSKNGELMKQHILQTETYYMFHIECCQTKNVGKITRQMSDKPIQTFVESFATDLVLY